MIFKDQLGRSIELQHSPTKIISLVPSQTELLFDLGLEKEIAGRTKFCIHPKDKVRDIPKIGGTKNIDIEKIYSLKPDLIIANKEENEEKQITELMNHYPVWVSDIHTVEDALSMIKSVGQMCNRVSEAALLEQQVNNKLTNFRNKITDIIPVAYLIWYHPYMTAGGDTFINYMLKTAGYKNVFSGKKRYPEVSLEEIILQKPEYIFLSSEPFPFKEKHIEEIRSLYPEQKVVIVDGEMFSWYGSRLLKAFDYFEKQRNAL